VTGFFSTLSVSAFYKHKNLHTVKDLMLLTGNNIKLGIIEKQRINCIYVHLLVEEKLLPCHLQFLIETFSII
jgi:hypothetical protein